MLVAARRFDDLGIAESPVPTPPPVEATVRTLRPAELPLPAELPRPTDLPPPAGHPRTPAVERDGTTG